MNHIIFFVKDLSRQGAKCPRCYKKLIDIKQLPSHLKAVHGIEKPYICDSPCVKDFSTMYNLDRHKLSSTCKNFQLENKANVCPNKCGKRFLQIAQLDDHIYKGNCPNKFQCHICPDKPYFHSKCSLDIHSASKHHHTEKLVQLNISLPDLKDQLGSRIARINVPVNSLKKGSTMSSNLEKILSQTITEATSYGLSVEQAASLIQSKVNDAFKL